MGKGDPIRIRTVMDVLGRSPKPGSIAAVAANYSCPFCDPEERRYTMNVNFLKDTFRCPKCDSKGGAIQLYSWVRFGETYVKGTEKAKECVKAFWDEAGGGKNPSASPKPKAFVPKVDYITAADDATLDRVYRALLSLPQLQLSQKHAENLKQRGLKDLRRYHTVPEWEQPQFPYLLRVQIAALPVRVNPGMVALGLTLVRELKKKGITDFTGVPGFYKIGQQWCFYSTPGILIPSYNHKRQIVGLQVRRDRGEIRYMTVSNKSLPGSVQDGIIRAHVVANFKDLPLGKFKVLITEGPLKADVIAALAPEPVLVLAIPGISSTSCLQPELDWLKGNGVTTLFNCLDMDRLTNPHVRAGSAELRRMLTEKGFDVKTMVWDRDAAIEKIYQLRAYAMANGVALPQKCGDPWLYLCHLCMALEAAGFVHHSDESHWPSRSKGYDDWLRFTSPPAN